MRKRRLWLSLLAFFSCAIYAGENNTVVMHGFDKMSCEDWTASLHNDATRQLYIAWIRGIVTGFNFANPDDQVALEQMPGDLELALHINRYCRGRPELSFAGAAFALIDKNRGKRASPSAAHTDDEQDAFEQWRKRQSVNLQSLDAEVLRKIYRKESALDSK